jgi:CelD/BcsL family acetyltransferase involved in cellulose biosynthesis
MVERRELPDYFDLLVNLHQKRRRSMGTEGCFGDAKFKSYHREVMERFFAMGRLRLQYVRLDDRPIAIEYGLIGGKTIYFYQSGIETDVLEQRPGWIGTIGSLRAAIEQGYQTFDFMRGDEAYKASWRAQAQPTLEVRIVAPRGSTVAPYGLAGGAPRAAMGQSALAPNEQQRKRRRVINRPVAVVGRGRNNLRAHHRKDMPCHYPSD